VDVLSQSRYGGWRNQQLHVHFYRPSGGWYDEIRYDSHDRKRGRAVMAPHFHMKLQSALKANADAAVEEIQEMIDNHIQSFDLLVKR
jgi:hypothetical protein